MTDVHTVVMKVVAAIVQDNGGDYVVTSTSKFVDLGFDRLDVQDVIMQVESIVNVSLPDDAINEQSAVCDLIELVEYRVWQEQHAATRP